MESAKVIGVVQEDRTVRTKGDEGGAPWRCVGCGSEEVWRHIKNGREVGPIDSFSRPRAFCDTTIPAHCLKGMAPQKTNKVGMILSSDSAERKETPITTGVLDYFPLAIAAVARHSKSGNDKHNPGQPLHWSREKSTDHVNCISRHLIDRGATDPDTGSSHTVGLAWRALALLELEEEERLGKGPSRGSK